MDGKRILGGVGSDGTCQKFATFEAALDYVKAGTLATGGEGKVFITDVARGTVERKVIVFKGEVQ